MGLNAKQVMKTDCDIAWREDVFEANKVFVKELSAFALKKGR